MNQNIELDSHLIAEYQRELDIVNSRFANCYFNYGSDTEMFEYVQPFLDEEFREERAEMIGALYYVRSEESCQKNVYRNIPRAQISD